MKQFFRVVKKKDEKEFTDFTTVEAARAYILEKDLPDAEYELRCYTADDVEFQFFFDQRGNPQGAVIRNPSDPGHVNVLAAIVRPR